MIIRDGSGGGNSLRITTENRASGDMVSRTITQHVNEVYQKHFSLTFDAIDPVGADDYFFYFKNTGTKSIHFTKFRFRSTVAGSVEIHEVTGTPSYTSDTDVTPANRYIGSSNTITATIKTDTNTTGLTNANTLIRLRLASTDTDYVDDAPSHIIVPPGQSIALLWDTATGALSGTIDIYEDQGIV
jgi:archaellum component FlaG (FlaF/FlaG flagellin family)